MVAFSVTIF